MAPKIAGAVTTVLAPALPLLRSAVVSMLLLSVPVAHSAMVTCAGGAATVPVLDPFSASAAVSDFTLTCSGGDAIDSLPTVNFKSFFNVSLLQTDTPVLTNGVNNVVVALVGANSVLFSAIPLNPVASSFSIQRIFVDPSAQAEGFQFLQFLSVTGEIPVPIFNPTQVVAINGTIAPPVNVPEPATGLLLAVAGAALFTLPRRRKATLDAAAT